MALSKILENSIATGAVAASKLKDFTAAVDLNGVELILDADQDTSITADTDDRIDFKIANVEHFSFSNSSGDTVVKPMVDAKDIIFQQYDGNKLFEINDGNFVSVGGNAAAGGEIRIYEDTDLGTNYTGFKAGNLTGSVAYQLPLADGSSGQALTTDSNGVLSWSTISTAFDDLTAGDAALNITTTAGNITIDAQGNDTDIIFKGTDGNSDRTFMTIDGSAGGDLFLTGGLIDLKNDGSAVSQIKFYCESSNAHAQTLIGAPHSESATNTLTLPSTGGNSYLLTAASTATVTNKTFTSPKINEDVAVTATATELNLLDGVSGLVQADLTKLAAIDATATEINLIDGGATVGTTAIADGDGLLINDAGTMRVSTVQTLAAYLDDEITAMPNLTSVGTLTALTVDDVAVDGKVITMTGSSGDTFVTTVGTNGATSLVTVDTAAAAAHLTITADGTVDINSAGVLTLDSGAAINIEPAAGSAILLDGTISVDAGVVTGATSITSTAFVGGLTGNVTGNTSGTALTVTQAAQTAITSVGTLSALQIDHFNINNSTISTTSGTDLNITPLSGQQIVLDGTIVIDAGVVTGATSITSTAFVGDITGDVAGNLTGTVATVTQNSITTMTGLVTTGALGTGSIAAGFGNIDNGASNITSGGLVKLDVDADADDVTGDSATGRLTIGAGEDLNLYHGGTNSYIVNDTGILNIQSAGGVVINENSANVDFRVESNGATHAIFLDASAEKVGFFEHTPSREVDVLGVLHAGADAGGTAGSGGGVTIGEIAFGSIAGDSCYVTRDGGHLLLSPRTNSASYGINMYSGQNLSLQVQSGGDVDVERGDIIFSTAGKGIVLGATSNTAANTLDDYEEGTWTPVLSTGGTIGYSTQSGTYTKVGRLVNANFAFALNAVNSLSGVVGVTGLPFTAANDSDGDSSPVQFGLIRSLGTSYPDVRGYVAQGNTVITFSVHATNAGHTGMPGTALTTSTIIYGSVTYASA